MSDALINAAEQIDSLKAENTKLRKYDSENKHMIHTLRKRCESLVHEMEELRAKIALYESLQEADRYPSQTWRATVAQEDKRDAKEVGDDE